MLPLGVCLTAHYFWKMHFSAHLLEKHATTFNKEWWISALANISFPPPPSFSSLSQLFSFILQYWCFFFTLLQVVTAWRLWITLIEQEECIIIGKQTMFPGSKGMWSCYLWMLPACLPVWTVTSLFGSFFLVSIAAAFPQNGTFQYRHSDLAGGGQMLLMYSK